MLDIFGSQGTVSLVLNGKREISKSQARKLSTRFRLPIDVFYKNLCTTRKGSPW